MRGTGQGWRLLLASLWVGCACATGCSSEEGDTGGQTLANGVSGASGSAGSAGQGPPASASSGRDAAGSGGAAAGSAGRGVSNSAGTTGGGAAGSATAGGSGNASGGSGGSGTGIDAPPPQGSSGCDAATWPQSGTFMLDVAGTPREYIVKIPADYSPSKPYKLIFAWHGLGGTAAQIASGFRGGYYGLETRAAGSTIFVAGQGLETSSGGAGWPNTQGRDIAFVRAMLDWLRGSYCIDEKRIFSTGMSYGGIMSNTIGCQLGDIFRAIAPMAGSGPRAFGGAQCVGQVAAWLSHGNMDTVVTFESGVASRDHWIMTNHCDATSAPTPPDACVAYQGCDDGFPVHFCEFTGGHTVPAFASEAIWNFFSQF